MKNNILLFVIILPLVMFSQSINVKNFKVNETINKTYNKGTRFDFQFEIQGDYRYSTHKAHQIDLFVYENSISSRNLIGFSYWNREDDRDLYFRNYTKKSWWFYSLKSYTTSPGKKFYLRVKYAGLTKTYSYVMGSTSTLKPDLKWNNSTTVYSDCFGCSSILDVIQKKNTYHEINNGFLNINYIIDNTGDKSSSTQVKFYLTNSPKSTQRVNGLEVTRTLNSIQKNSYKHGTFSFSNSDFQAQNGSYYLTMQIVKASGETNTSNNISYIPLKISGNTFLNRAFSEQSYLVEVKNFFTQKTITSRIVKNTTEENEFIEEVKKETCGLVVINKKGNSKVTYIPCN